MHGPPLPQGKFLILTFRGWFDPRAHGSGGSHGKIDSGIDPGTSRLVAQCLNHYATPRPLFFMYSTRYSWVKSPVILVRFWWNFSFLDRNSESTHMKFHENSSSGSRVVPCGQTDTWGSFWQFCYRAKGLCILLTLFVACNCRSKQQLFPLAQLPWSS